ncbi:MAG TPA: hypothetical protein VGC88_12360, partial [Terriglobales bacterium]
MTAGYPDRHTGRQDIHIDSAFPTMSYDGSFQMIGRREHIAFGAPGIPPRWTSGAKDGIGTAYSIASKVWFTIVRGCLTEIYYPT